jgi:hypothetical protein
MLDIGFGTQTCNGGRINPHNAYVVQQRSLLDESLIGLQLRMIASYRQGLISHRAAMLHEDIVQMLLTTILVNNLLDVHSI